MIKDLNGKPYTTSGSMRQYNPESQDLLLFDQWDEESIRLGGSPIFYYEVLIQNATLDKLYMEDRGKLFLTNPIQLFAIYDPPITQFNRTTFGILTEDQIILELNYRTTIEKIGHVPKVGSRIYTPHRKENWMLQEWMANEFKKWHVLRIQLLCKKFQESVTTGEGTVTINNPDFEIR